MLCPSARCLGYPRLGTGSPQEDPSRHDCKIADWGVKNPNKQIIHCLVLVQPRKTENHLNISEKLLTGR